MKNLIWLHSGSCNGDTISFLNASQSDILTTLRLLDIKILWHPSLSIETGDEVISLLKKIQTKKEKLSILIVEGAICNGPKGTGKYCLFYGKPLRDWILKLAKVAEYTVALGTCASFGGIPASGDNPFESTGLQFLREEKGGLLGKDYISGAGLPVINVPGCPAHPDWLIGTLKLITDKKIKDILNKFNKPKMFYGKLAHHACPRNEYYEFKASALEYSQQGCLFEYLGCKATQCESDCNERLWLGRTGSCTRGGFPCISCTSPRFPDGFVPFFETAKIGDIPITLPVDVPKAWYIGISGLSKLACPKRLRENAVSFKKIDIEKD